MRKRLIERITHAKKGSLGYTLTELLVVIGIIAIVCAIAIPSIFAIRDALRFAQANNYAKSIFLAAQQNLTEMRSDGGLGPVQTAGGAQGIPASVTSFPNEYRGEYVYTTTGTEAFSRVLPAGSIDADLRDDQIVIEYNPWTGNVYSVFYYDKNDLNLAGQYPSNLPREKDTRKAMMLGYYDGSGLNSSHIDLEDTQAIVEYENGQEGIVRVKIPMPDSFFGEYNDFANALRVNLTITGEQSTANGAVAATPLRLQIKEINDLSRCELDVDGKTVVVEFAIDSLTDYNSFANFASGTQALAAGVANTNQKCLTTLANETAFIYKVLPGENITIQADVTYEGTGSDMVDIAPGILFGVNPMFEYLLPTGDDSYVLAVSNGRNLQNLNAIAPSIAEKVETVVFTSDIYWNDTVAYYNNMYGQVEGDSKSYKNIPAEAPARALPYFVPIHSEALFGTAKFDYGVQSWASNLPDGWLKDILTSIFDPNSRVPTLTDEFDTKKHAAISGSDQINNDGAQIYNLNIDSTKYDIGKDYYAGTADADTDRFTGMISYANTTIDNIHIVNPIIKGYYFDGTNNPATGALLGCGGYNTYISNCSTYLDTSDPTYSYTKMMGQAPYSKDTTQNWYGVSGEGAVGGLVGYAKSHRTTTGELDPDKDVLAFYNCFAAVNVSGNMREEVELKSSSLDLLGISKYYGYATKDYGYTNGIGGLVGNSELTNFYNCYASGNVRATNTNAAKKYKVENNFLNSMANLFGIELEFQFSGRESSGAGGFVGTSHGTRYTNCFATGTVTGTNSSTDLGIGGFVGVMCVDETFTYGNQNDSNLSNAHVAQRTVFTNCYSAGLVTSDGDPAENFSGANARVIFDIEEYGAAQVADYYRLLGRHLRYNSYSLPNYEDFYIYKDTYYLSKYLLSEEPNSNNCASPAAYSTLLNLPGNHLNKDWIDSQITSIKKIVLYDILGLGWIDKTYGEQYFDKNGKVEEIYVQEYKKGFQTGWNQPTASTTHGYDMTGTFPFSKLASLDYYGDWPSKPLANGIAYYEVYEKNENGSYSRFYHFDRESTSQLKNADDKIVIKDGYAILSSTNGAMTITVNGASNSFSKGSPDDSYTANNKVYHVYLLTDEQMSAATAYTKTSGQFYVPVTFTQEGSTHTYYFNPNVAKSQVNGSNNHTFIDSNSDDSCDTCGNGLSHEYHLPTGKEIYIRSARQFAALSIMTNYLSDDYRYVQQLNIDASKYQWENANDKKLGSIGTDAKPFNGTYTGFYIDEETFVESQYKISGFENAESGLFGVIGKTGNVSDLIVECGNFTAGSSAVDNAAVLAAVNNGTIDNVDLTFADSENTQVSVALTAKNNAGLLAGLSSGSIVDCDVTAAQNVSVTINAANAGGMVGNAAGTDDAKATISNSPIQLPGTFTANSKNVGGMIGIAADLDANLISVKIGTISSNGEHVGGLAGAALNSSFIGISKDKNGANPVDISVDSITAAKYAAGAIGGIQNVTLTGLDVQVGTVSGAYAAGFLGEGIDLDETGLNMGRVNVTNGTVKVTEAVTGTSGAAGAAITIGAQSNMERVPLTLTGVTVSSENGKAAGYALKIEGDSYVSNCPVTLGSFGNAQSAVTISAPKGEAVGYACSIDGIVASSYVAGSGSISGSNAAGFANSVNGRISGCYVTPALTHSTAGYHNNSNDNLVVNGSRSAAGFALTLDQDAEVSNIYTLCKITSQGTVEIEDIQPIDPTESTESTESTDSTESTESTDSSDSTESTAVPTIEHPAVYGFAGTNAGTIIRCYANVTIDGGFAFINENTGVVTTCYGWYDNSAQDEDVITTVKGSCFSSFFANLENEDIALYDTEGVYSATTLSALSIDSLDGFTTGYASYPYNPNITPANYPYPMLRDHCGNWYTPPQYAYGVAYYEIYTDSDSDPMNNPAKVHMYDLSDVNVTEEEQLLNIQIGGSFDNTGIIERTGYAIFRKDGSDMLSNYSGEQVPMLSYTSAEATYYFYELKDSGVVNLPATVFSEETVNVDTRFADAIGDFSVYQVRTAEQLTNVGQLPTAAFNQTHDITIADGTFPGIATFGGSYNGGSLKITVGTGAEWMSQVTGTVQNVNLTVNGTITESIFGNVTGTLDTIAVTCGSTASGVIDSVSGSDTADASLTNVDLTITGEVTAFAGSGLLVNSLGSNTGISNCDVMAGSIALNVSDIPESEAGGIPSNPFGGITGVVPAGVTLSGNTVTASLSVQGADQTLTVIGGLAGSNSGTISGSKTNVDVTYVQPTETTDKAILGGLVGTMNSGSIEGSGSNDATGSITLSGDGNGRAYVVGGAVGALTDGSVVSSTAVNVAVAPEWAGSNNRDGGNTFGTSGIVNNGPIGMFVGYAGNVSLTNCSSTETTNETYQFLGEAMVESTPLSNLWKSDVKKTGALKAYSDHITDGVYTTYDPVGYSFSAATSTNRVAPTISGCFFLFGGATKEQCYGVAEHYYAQTSAKENGYVISGSVVAPVISSTSFNATDDEFNSTPKSTGCYYFDSTRYYPVSVRYEKGGFLQAGTFYLVETGNESNVLTQKKGSYNWRGYYEAEFTLSKFTNASLNGTYATIKDNGAAINSQAVEFTVPSDRIFDQRDELLYCIWNASGNRITNIADGVAYDMATSFTTDGSPVMVYEVGGVFFNLYPVQITANGSRYSILTFTYQDNADYQRQFITAK